MTDSGPTTVGSIVSKLKLDFSDWAAGKQRAKDDAREIGALNPTVKVSMDTGQALAELEALNAAASRAGVVSPSASPSVTSVTSTVGTDAVAAAERRLAAAVAASEAATNRATLAQMRLDEIESKGAKSAYSLAAAQEAARAAIDRADVAAMRAIAAEDALGAAQQQAAKRALEEAAANEVGTAAKVKANEANKTTATRMGLITGAVATLLPMLAPLGAFTIGAAGAFTMMGVSGVLAILGIKNEMAQGTAVGNAYSAGISSLKGNLNELSQTSAVGMLSSFQRIVGDTNASMPLLNRNVSEFSVLLGKSGANLFSSAISSIGVLEPLLLKVGAYVEGLTAKFQAWTTNGGLKSFANYAIATLPQVEQVLSAVGSAVMHILTALAPLGTVGMAILTGVSNVISALPVPMITELVAAVTWGMLAFKTWGFIAPMLATITQAVAIATDSIGLLGTSMTIATGPIGWVLAGVGALAAVIAFSAATTQQATAAVQDYTTAVQADTGAIGDNVKATAAKALLDAGAYAAAKKLGISTQLVTQAALGQGGAQVKLNALLGDAGVKANVYGATMTGLTDKQKAVKAAIDTLSTSVWDNSGSVKSAVDAYNTLQEAQGGTTISTNAQKAAVEAEAKAAGVSVTAYLAATTAQASTKAQTEQATAAMYLQNDAAGLLKQSLDLLNGKTISAASAQNQFDSQLANMSTHMDATGKTVNRADTLLTGMTASAVKNRGELINLTSAAEANAQAFRDNGGSADATRQKLIDMKKAIVDNAAAHGEDRDQVQSYVDTIFKIPASVPPTKIEVDTAAAMEKLNALLAAYDQVARQGTVVAGRGAGASQSAVVGLYHGPGHASGGAINGPGSGTSDTAGLFPLSNGEHVLTALDVQAMGGQSAVYKMRAMLAAGKGFTMPAAGTVRAAAPTAGVSTSATATAPADRPIYADGIGLIGWIKQLANGQAQLVFNQGMNKAALEMAGGLA